MERLLICLVILAMLSPTMFATLGDGLFDALTPIAEKGLELAIIVAVILWLIGKCKL